MPYNPMLRRTKQEDWLQLQVQPGQQSQFQASLSSKVRSGLKTEPATKEINEKAKEKTEKSKSWFWIEMDSGG